jgi:hypothetical protein
MERPRRIKNYLRAALLVSVAVAVVVATVSILVEARRAVPVAEAVGTCPVTITVTGPQEFIWQEGVVSLPVLPDTPARNNEFVHYKIGDNARAFADLRDHATDIALVTTPVQSNLGLYEWQLAVGLYAVEYDKTAVSRVDNSAQVIADDWINYMRTPAGVSVLGSLGYTTIPPAAVPPIPDWDVNLDGSVSLGDLGQVVGRWGATSSCIGWIRPDENNDGKVSLGDIGGIIAHWGQAGLICNNTTNGGTTDKCLRDVSDPPQ